MAPQDEPISVRTTRLNGLILGRSVPNNAAACRKSLSSTPAAAFRHRVSGSSGVSREMAEAVSRESLLDAFCLLYSECDKEALKDRDCHVAEFVEKYGPIVKETHYLRVNIDDFNIKTLIGKGYFGDVYLVVERQTGDVYAMKKIKKTLVTTSQAKEERQIMSRRCSEWITNLQYAFQDNDNLYLIMEYLPGGDLLTLMTRHGPFDEDLARFYLAELTVAIHSLHSMGYVHCDVKPENILIDRFGHIKLADFGNAAAMQRDGHVFSLSPVGTTDYIAPELLQTNSAHMLIKTMLDVSCDFWSMGIIGYELICGITPFHGKNVHDTYCEILNHCEGSHLKIVTFPSDVILSANFKELIECLVTNSSNRLTHQKIRQHAFFDCINWETLRSQAPPIIPIINGDVDTSNFGDVTRNEGHSSPLMKNFSSLTSDMKSNEFCGKDLPFIGYTFVHMEKHVINTDAEGNKEDARFTRLDMKLKDLQTKLKERIKEIIALKGQLLRAEQIAKQSNTTAKILQEAKEEINKMKNIIKEKTVEMASCKTQIKTLQSSVKVEQEMWEKKEATITELFRVNRKKYEDAKVTTEKRYEKLIAEKKDELANVVRKLDAREGELNGKIEECKQLQEKTETYKEMLRQIKEQAHLDKQDFEKNKLQLNETYEQKLMELRNKLREEKYLRSQVTMELCEVRNELDVSKNSSRPMQESKLAIEERNDQLLKRLNSEIEANNVLHAENAKLQQQLITAEKTLLDQQQDISRLERGLKFVECDKNLAEFTPATQLSMSFEKASVSLPELHVIEEQLRADLEAAKENENAQMVRADKLQEAVEKLEAMLKEQSLLNSSTQGATPPSPRLISSSVGDLLEKQSEKLEDRLTAVRNQVIIERQAARTTNLSLWKVEKKLVEALAEKKAAQRRIELKEDVIKKIKADRDEAQRLHKTAQSAVQERDQRLCELKDENAALKQDVLQEHLMWEKAEEERMKCKSEIIEHISSVQGLVKRFGELRLKLQRTQQKCDSLSLENRRLLLELNYEHDRSNASVDKVSELQVQLKNLQDNYERLKYACTVTDSQLTEVQTMLEDEQKRSKVHQEKLNKFNVDICQCDDMIAQMRKELHDERSQKEAAESHIRSMDKEMKEHILNMAELQKKLISQQGQLIDNNNQLFEAQEQVEVLTSMNANLQTMNENYERELKLLKEENTRILTELFHAKEQSERLQQELEDSLANATELHNEIEEQQEILAEKENYYNQRDFKSVALLAQHRKLIDYLQLKVEDLSQKKKPSLTEKLFGVNTHGYGTNKENVFTAAAERTLQEELRREKQRSKSLRNQIDLLKGLATKSSCKTLLESSQRNEDNTQKDANTSNQTKSSQKSPSTTQKLKIDNLSSENKEKYHRFVFALEEKNNEHKLCCACQKTVAVNSPHWKCKECLTIAHRKCRSDAPKFCGTGSRVTCQTTSPPTAKDVDPKMDQYSLSKYSYEAKFNDVDGVGDSPSGETKENYNGTLVFSVELPDAATEPLVVNCALETEEQQLVLFGCNTGLFALHIKEPQRLIQIAGIDSVSGIAVSLPMAKAILIGTGGKSLHQCDFRQLLSRSQIGSTYLSASLDTLILDLPFTKHVTNDKWQLVKISKGADALDSVAIATTLTRIVIMRYDLETQKFMSVRVLDTVTPVSSILFTRFTAILSSNRFYEINLETYETEEFVDLADMSLSHTLELNPVEAFQISKQEFLLCFKECGIFVDEFGSRSRPSDLSWEYTPTGFWYREPFLYISHLRSVQILRLHRSYTQEIMQITTENEDADADVDENLSGLKRIYLEHHAPALLTESGNYNLYILVTQHVSNLQQIYHLDALQSFKHKLDDSLETISSVATSITVGSQSINNEKSID